MRTPIRWVGVAVVTSATFGGAAAMIYVPVSSSAATKVVTAATPTPDLVTPQIASLANTAQQLSSEIVVAHSELERLKQQVANEAATRYYQPVATPIVRVQTTPTVHSTSATRHVSPAASMTIAKKRPVTHTTTGASGKGSHKDDAGRETDSSSAHGDD